jgi:hypothetical protein
MAGIRRWLLSALCLLVVLLGLSSPAAAWNGQGPLVLNVAIKVGNVNRFSARDKT